MVAVLNTLAPVFLLIALGAILRRARLLSGEALGGMGWLVFWIALPALLFREIASARRFGFEQASIFVILLAGMAACILAGYGLARVLRIPRPKVGTFVQAAYRGNLAYIGLPVVLYAFTSVAGEAAGRTAQQDATVALAPLIPLYNVTAVIVLLAGQHKLSAAALRRMGWQILINPLILSCVAGLAWAIAGLRLPMAIDNTLRILGQVAGPLALLSVGAAIATTRISGEVLYTSVAVALKVLIAPLVGYAVAMLLGAPARQTFIALLLLACPTAVAAYIMAEQMHGDSPLAAQTVVISTLASIAAFAVIILMMS